MELCEEFTDDNNVVVWHLRQSVMDIPGQIAVDLIEGNAPKLEALVRCAAQIELVHKIYPGTDTDPVEEGLKKIMQIIDEGKFSDISAGSNQTQLTNHVDAVSIKKEA